MAANLSFLTAALILVTVRVLGVAFAHVTDCDEVYNYWEPLHFLLYGSGSQTWEYSPVYALRSYAYLLPHGAPARVLSLLVGVNDKVTIFYATRAALGICSALCEAKLCASASRSVAFGPKVAWLTLGFLAVSPGMTQASVAFLPSSSAMYLCTAAVADWMHGRTRSAIFGIAASTLVVWPFSGALGIPIALDVAVRRGRIVSFIGTSLAALAVFLGPTLAIDSYFYCKPVFAALNIVLYNVLSENTSSELYGTEPWTFYFVNGFLNLNVAFVAGLLGPLIALLAVITGGASRRRAVDRLLYLAPIMVWVLIFFPQAHKEERFLFPMYPLVCLSGAYAVASVISAIASLMQRIPSSPFSSSSVSKLLLAAVFAVACVLSASRTIAVYKAYHAPMDVYRHVHAITPTREGIRICVGKEWYRFPSSFFLPPPLASSHGAVSFDFIKSEFSGLLPGKFAEHASGNATWVIPEAMNNMNAEEPSRYVDVATCDYIIDQDRGAMSTALEPNFRTHRREWEEVACYPFLEPARTNALYRAFYIPGVSAKQTVYNAYCLLKRKPF
eukprot:m.521822 g.521822  ORF g.521822 m.521822 type:complete len:558 (-) comp21964_c0_seq5:127-1800(-)